MKNFIIRLSVSTFENISESLVLSPIDSLLVFLILIISTYVNVPELTIYLQGVYRSYKSYESYTIGIISP